MAIFYEGLVKEYGEELKVRFLETFEFYKEIYNCEERMADWRKVKYDLKRYNKFSTLYKKLKSKDLKEYEGEILSKLQKKRNIVQQWSRKPNQDDKVLKTKPKRKKRRKPLTKKKLALMEFEIKDYLEDLFEDAAK